MNSYKIEFGFEDYIMANSVEEAKEIFINRQQDERGRLVHAHIYELVEPEEQRLH